MSWLLLNFLRFWFYSSNYPSNTFDKTIKIFFLHFDMINKCPLQYISEKLNHQITIIFVPKLPNHNPFWDKSPNHHLFRVISPNHHHILGQITSHTRFRPGICHLCNEIRQNQPNKKNLPILRSPEQWQLKSYGLVLFSKATSCNEDI